MADYGVIPEGFNRKPLTVVLAEIENGLITEFGPDFVQTAQSPAGQLNGVYSDASSQLWELAQEIYQSLDPDQAENLRLDMLGKIRRIVRIAGESDTDYRKAMTNEGRARIDLQDIERALGVIPGVTYFQVWTREDTDELPQNEAMCVAITGGDLAEIGQVLRAYVAPGVTLFGNASAESLIDGRCRSFPILRPITVPVTLELVVKRSRDTLGCPPPSLLAVKTFILENLYFLNGENLTFYKIRQLVESQFANVEVISFTGSRDSIASPQNEPVVFGFIERASLALDDLLVTDAP